MVAPASANVIGKIAYGIADDMLTTTVMACPCKKMISPAMNHNMYHNPIVQDNIRKLERFGYEMIAPDRGMLANGDDGDGRMPEPEVLFEYILRELAFEKDQLICLKLSWVVFRTNMMTKRRRYRRYLLIAMIW